MSALLIVVLDKSADLLLLLIFARAGVVRVTVARPARPRNNGGTT